MDIIIYRQETALIYLNYFIAITKLIHLYWKIKIITELVFLGILLAEFKVELNFLKLIKVMQKLHLGHI